VFRPCQFGPASRLRSRRPFLRPPTPYQVYCVQYTTLTHSTWPCLKHAAAAAAATKKKKRDVAHQSLQEPICTRQSRPRDVTAIQWPTCAALQDTACDLVQLGIPGCHCALQLALDVLARPSCQTHMHTFAVTKRTLSTIGDSTLV
jgi:hypothetical protein